MSTPLSPKNSEVARLRALVRQRRARYNAGRFVVEGQKLVAEVLLSELAVVGVYCDAEWTSPQAIDSAAADRGLRCRELTGRAVERIVSTTSPQPVLAEVELPAQRLDLLAGGQAAVVAVDVNDPGNVGTLARSAEAAGFDAFVVAGSTADPFGPKAIRASGGAIFRVGVVSFDDASDGLSKVGQAGYELVGTRMNDALDCDQADLTGRVAMVLGSEAHGLGTSHDAAIDRWLRIPMAGSVESLNVAMAGTILSYEIARQRRALR